MRSTNLLREALGAWIVALFILGVGLSVLALHERDGRSNRASAISPRWSAPPVADIQEGDSEDCRRDNRSCLSALPAPGDWTDRTIARSGGDRASWC
jgi:hypothetical protein